MNSEKCVYTGYNILANLKVANLDKKYGPYESIQQAILILTEADLIERGLTVGILENGKIVEYWFNGENEIPELVKKQLAFITLEQIDNWNNKSNFSGSYEDLTNVPTNLQGVVDKGVIYKTLWKNIINSSGNYYEKGAVYKYSTINNILSSDYQSINVTFSDNTLDTFTLVYTVANDETDLYVYYYIFANSKKELISFANSPIEPYPASENDDNHFIELLNSDVHQNSFNLSNELTAFLIGENWDTFGIYKDELNIQYIYSNTEKTIKTINNTSISNKTKHRDGVYTYNTEAIMKRIFDLCRL